ncbi:hypothetical protein apy_05150, partial [Aeropyrum pernix]
GERSPLTRRLYSLTACNIHLAAALAMLGLAVAVHHPGLEGPIYSDVVHLYLSRVAPLEGGDPLLPYRDFHLEYPPLVGLLWLLSVNTRIPGLTGLESHYIVQALAAAAMGLLSVEAVRRLAGVKRALAAALLPSMAVYSVYNWDLLAAAPMLWGLYMFKRGRVTAAGVLLGLGGAAKLLPLLAAAPLPVVAGRRGVKAAATAFAVTAASFLATEALAPGFIEAFYRHHAGWYIEGSWLLVFGDPFSEELRRVAQALAAFAVLAALAASRLLRLDPVTAAFVTLSAYLLGTYVYTPQMNLFPALLALSTPLFTPSLYPVLLAQDTAAAAVILTWHTTPNPLDPLAPPTIATYVKTTLLLAIAAALLYRAYKQGGSRREQGQAGRQP